MSSDGDGDAVGADGTPPLPPPPPPPPPPPAIARKVGEGYGRPDAELPLDIQYGQLADWLMSRGKIPPDWHARVAAIQARARELAAALPPGVARQAAAASPCGASPPLPSSGPPLPPAPLPLDNYFAAVAARDALAATGERTLFGGLAGQALAWDKVVKAYEQGAVFLGEAASLLAQATDYDLPSLRRQAARLSQAVADAERRVEEQTRAAAAAAAAFARECAAAGVDPARAGAGEAGARGELRLLAARLPAAFDETVVRAVAEGEDLWEAAEYYAALVAHAHGPPGKAGGGVGADDVGGAGGAPPPPSSSPPAAAAAAVAAAAASAALLLPTLAEVREGRTEAPPPSDEEEEEDQGGDNGKAVEVDWGAMLAAGIEGGEAGTGGGGGGDVGGGGGGDNGGGGGGGGDGAGISWDIDLSAAAAADAAAEPAEGASVEAAEAPSEARWDIGVAADDGGGDEAEEEGGGGGANNNGGAAAAAAATTTPTPRTASAAARRLVRDGDYRARLADDLHELRAFLLVRLSEMSALSPGAGAVATAAQSQQQQQRRQLLLAVAASLPARAQRVDARACARMLASADAALAALSDPSARRLLRLAASPAHLERRAAELARTGGQEARLLAGARESAARQREARALLQQAAPRVAEAAARLRALKARAEAELERLLGGARRVNLQGEINVQARG